MSSKKVESFKLLLAIVDPEYTHVIDLSNVERDKHLFLSAAKMAERNGLYYYFILRLRQLNLALPFHDKKRWEAEQRRLERFRNTITALNNICRDYGINYILLRTTIPHIPKDVDIFANKEDKKKIIFALEKEKTKYGKNRLLRVDIYTKIRYLTIDFLNEDFLWSSVIHKEMFDITYPSLNKEADFLFSLVHSLFEHRSMSLCDFLNIKFLKNRIDVNTCKKYAIQNGWGEVFDLYIRELDSLCRRIYEEGEFIQFPYIFSRNFVLQAILTIEGLHLSPWQRMALSVSLSLDKIQASQEETTLYKLLRSFKPVRWLFNQTMTAFKSMRGDKEA